MTLPEPIAIPQAERDQLDNLQRLLKLGAPELIGPKSNERISLPPTIYRALKDVVQTCSKGAPCS